MEIHLTSDQKAFIREAIANGRIRHAEEAVEQALSLWEERERRRVELLASLEEAEASIARGEAIPLTKEALKKLAEDVKREGRAKLAKSLAAAG